MMEVQIVVKLKEGVLDPQGQAIQRSMSRIGHDEVLSVRQGRYFELHIREDDVEAVRQLSQEIAAQILSNPLIEDFEIREIS